MWLRNLWLSIWKKPISKCNLTSKELKINRSLILNLSFSTIHKRLLNILNSIFFTSSYYLLMLKGIPQALRSHDSTLKVRIQTPWVYLICNVLKLVDEWNCLDGLNQPISNIRNAKFILLNDLPFEDFVFLLFKLFLMRNIYFWLSLKRFKSFKSFICKLSLLLKWKSIIFSFLKNAWDELLKVLLNKSFKVFGRNLHIFLFDFTETS